MYAPGKHLEAYIASLRKVLNDFIDGKNGKFVLRLTET